MKNNTEAINVAEEAREIQRSAYDVQISIAESADLARTARCDLLEKLGMIAGKAKAIENARAAAEHGYLEDLQASILGFTQLIVKKRLYSIDDIRAMTGADIGEFVMACSMIGKKADRYFSTKNAENMRKFSGENNG